MSLTNNTGSEHETMQMTPDNKPPAYDKRWRNINISQVRDFCIGRPFMLLCALFAAIFISFQAEVIGAVFFVLLISALLVICDDVLATTMPFMSVCVLVLQCYDSFNTFIKFAPLAVIPVAAVLYHFIKYRKRPVIGIGITGLIAVAVALTFGGSGAIPKEEYFAPTALFYVAALGVGMIVVYLLLRPRMGNGYCKYEFREKFVDIMYITGALACFQIIEIYAESMLLDSRDFIGELGDGKVYPNGMSFSDIVKEFSEGGLFGFHSRFFSRRLQPGNNISTFLMLALPFPMYRAVKGKSAHLLSVAAIMICLILTKSRGGIVCGFLELLICLVCMAFVAENKWLRATFIAIPTLAVGVAAYVFIESNLIEKIHTLIPEDDVRVQLILRSFKAFEDNPVFGQGIGSMANADLYNGKAGTIPWYHMMIPQVIGSMGLVGIAAYCWQLFVRARMAIKKFSPFVMTLALSYVGLFLMTQVNPGEFCPFPYGIIAVIMFIFIENEPDAPKIVRNGRAQANTNEDPS